MNRYIGIGKEVNDRWYTITLLMFNRMIKLTLYTQKYKKPKYYYYNKEQFDYCMNEQKLINLKWFFGVGLNCL